jgi:hypothetical protein
MPQRLTATSSSKVFLHPKTNTRKTAIRNLTPRAFGNANPLSSGDDDEQKLAREFDNFKVKNYSTQAARFNLIWSITEV